MLREVARELERYEQRRNFERTTEPRGQRRKTRGAPRFVVQKHDARRLHYDLRLEHDGVLKSWAVPRGPSLDPQDKRLAVEVEDHPLDYADFEGLIPKHEYGGGAVLVWDQGTWRPEGDVARGLEQGKLDFELDGDKLHGRWTLVRLASRRQEQDRRTNWLLMKRQDAAAREGDGSQITQARPESVLSGRRIEGVANEERASQKKTSETGRRGERSETRARAVSTREAKEAALPQRPSPQLATLVDRVPEGSEWLHEIKLDGYRLLCRVDDGEVKLLTRRGHDWTERFPHLAQAAAQLPCRRALLDGEAVLFDESGVSDFQRLQNAIGDGDPRIVLVAFDLLHLDGTDLTRVPLHERKHLLAELLQDPPPSLRYGDHQEGNGRAFFQQACQLGLEGVISKRSGEPYRGRRTRSWLKTKCQHRQEFVIVGFTEPQGSRVGLGALLLGVHDGKSGPLRYAGKVGTGFDQATLRKLRAALDERERQTAPLTGVPRNVEREHLHWVRAELVCEVAFAGWTQDGVLRQATFQGLREDKPASEIVQEHAATPEAEVEAGAQRKAGAAGSRQGAGAVRIAGVALSHPDKVLYPEQGATKRALAEYWERVAPWALPTLRDRPLTLVRCPEGQQGECFYQKHLRPGVAREVPRVQVREGEAPYAYVDDVPALIALVQLGVLELHAWGSRVDRLEQPDCLVFDLDPGEDVAFGQVVRGAQALRERLEALGLHAFVRLTGGKGLHVVVPVEPGPEWPDAKRFTREVAREMAAAEPDRYVAVMSKEKRRGRVFIDYLRNDRDATAAVSYTVRARPGAPVALPVEWEALDPGASEPPKYNLQEVLEVLNRRERDPWEGYEQSRKPLL